ncbi:MAG: hypothetical protein ABI856_04475, partial [Nitrospira sp.]
MSAMQRLSAVVIPALFMAAVLSGVLESSLAQSERGTEFVGTVLSVDTSSGKFAVKKDGGGSRFTFVANEKTHFDGGANAVKDLKKDDHVTVLYQVQG